MLDFPRYLLGVADLALLAGFAALGGSALRARLLPGFSGAPAHLATGVIALALLIWSAELLGTVGLLDPVLLLLVVALTGLGSWALTGSALPRRVARGEGGRGRPRPQRPPPPVTGPAGQGGPVPMLLAGMAAALALVKFGIEIKPNLTAGMTGFDSTWYHGPFAAGFFQSGDTWELHFLAPQFLAWLYPANAEIFHAIGMGAFGRDLLSPLLNLGWFAACLLACWCVGRPYGVAPWSLALGAVALSVPAFADQAGEARNDIVGTFFLLAAIAIALGAKGRAFPTPGREHASSVVVVGLAAGLAAGTKLNFLLPAAVLVLGLAFVAPAGARRRSLLMGGLGALAGGGYWYLRNLVHTGNPLPWIDSIGPISLPAPDQALGGREGHSVLGYLGDGAVWSDWFLPRLDGGLWLVWPLLLLAALAGLLLCLAPLRGFHQREGERHGVDRALALAGLVGLAASLAWLIAPTSASGPEGLPRGFESGLRYLVPALVLGLALLPAALPARLREPGVGRPPNGRILKVPRSSARHLSGRGAPGARLAAALAGIALIAIGYPVQRHYLDNRYAEPTFAAPGLNAAFAWAGDVSDARVATTGTRQYPLFGTDLSNEVQFVGSERPHGGFTAPTTCGQWRRLLEEGDYDYVIATWDRLGEGDSRYPPTAGWTEGPGATEILRVPPTIVFRISGRMPVGDCP